MHNADQHTAFSTGDSAKVLIPVDFSPKGSLALQVGFELARRLNKSVELIHASAMVDSSFVPQFPDDFNGLDNEESEIEEMQMEMEVHSIDMSLMDKLRKEIKEKQQEGALPEFDFDSVTAPGMPEEVIAEYCADSPPAVIVMATRGREKRMEELIGSVTAEVIDHCIAPVFTVPELYSFTGFKDIVRICAFCYFDEGDFKAVEKLMGMFGNPEVKIYLFPATDKIKDDRKEEALEALLSRLKERYPNSEFLIGKSSGEGNLRKEAEAFFLEEKIQMILAPNHKKNALARLFNPGLPHKILYEIDFPMLAIPV